MANIGFLFSEIQGAAGGALQWITNLFFWNFPPWKEGRCRFTGSGGGSNPFPYLGGWLTDNYSWRWVFSH